MKLTGISFIGADEQTQIEDLYEMCAKSPIPIEIGLLYSPNKAGKQKRYPSLKYIEKFLKTWHVAEMKYYNIDFDSEIDLSDQLDKFVQLDNIPTRPTLSLHLCGEGVRQFLHQENSQYNSINDICVNFERLQLNFSMSEYDPQQLANDIIKSLGYYKGNIVLQNNKSKKEFNRKFVGLSSIDFLFDGSGGFGRVLDNPEQPIANHYCGYAGGIGPDTVEEILTKIYKLNNSNTPFYLDMESKIREDNNFSIEKCQQVINSCIAIRNKYENHSGEFE